MVGIQYYSLSNSSFHHHHPTGASFHFSAEAPADMLDLLLQSRRTHAAEETSRNLTENDIIDDIILFLIAGHETVTNALCWTLLELARHPEMQEKCRQEVFSITGDGSPLDYNSSSQ